MTKRVTVSSKRKLSASASKTGSKLKEGVRKSSSKDMPRERTFLSANVSGLGPLVGKIFFIIFLPFKILVRFLRWYMGLFRKIPFGKVVSIIVLGIVVIGSWYLYDLSRFKFMEHRVNNLAESIAEDLKPVLGEYTVGEEKSCRRGHAAYGEYGDYGCYYMSVLKFSNTYPKNEMLEKVYTTLAMDLKNARFYYDYKYIVDQQKLGVNISGPIRLADIKTDEQWKNIVGLDYDSVFGKCSTNYSYAYGGGTYYISLTCYASSYFPIYANDK